MSSVRYFDFPGSSPRGRGTRSLGAFACRTRRFIPAWAGNTSFRIWSKRCDAVHPRVGGEHPCKRTAIFWMIGSSPRGRGTPNTATQTLHDIRFIPAWAGNTRSKAAIHAAMTVHPRVGGEHCVLLDSLRRSGGSSPRGRGTRRASETGNRPLRFIPAWAGNTSPERPSDPLRPVHPRVGGEHKFRIPQNVNVDGSSPRGRGTPTTAPATRNNRQVHPRVGGEHPVHLAAGEYYYGSSPRGRGTRDLFLTQTTGERFIPAWAGNTSRSAPPGTNHSVHPRVGGEHRYRKAAYASVRRFIPAWAGNTPIGICGANFNIGSSPRGRGTLFA